MPIKRRVSKAKTPLTEDQQAWLEGRESVTEFESPEELAALYATSQQRRRALSLGFPLHPEAEAMYLRCTRRCESGAELVHAIATSFGCKILRFAPG